MPNPTIELLISWYRDVDEAAVYKNFVLEPLQPLDQSAREILMNTPSSFGACAVLSSMWVGYIGDLSIFRTAYKIQGESHLKSFIMSTFGTGKGAFLSSKNDLPKEMKYIPKYVLKNSQIDSLIAGLAHQVKNGI